MSGTFVTGCTPGVPLIYEPGFDTFTGTVKADGSFTAGTSFLSVSGTVPKTAGGTWQGTYTLGQVAANCPIGPFSGSFTATPLADLTGTYAGAAPLQFSDNPVVSGNALLGITLTTRQGAPLQSSGSTANSRIGLTGSIAITGIPCVTGGTIGGQYGAQVQGNQLYAYLTMSDGSSAEFGASSQNAAGTQLAIDFFEIDSGPCTGVYNFGYAPLTLKKQ